MNLFDLSENLKILENQIFDKITNENSDTHNFQGYFETKLSEKPSNKEIYQIKKNLETRLNAFYTIEKHQYYYFKVESIQHFFYSRDRKLNDYGEMGIALPIVLTLGLLAPVYFFQYLKKNWVWYFEHDYFAFQYKIIKRESNLIIEEEKYVPNLAEILKD
jgi:hypothetical protein